MPESNYERMMRLVDEVFAVKNDPSQLDVDQEVLERLKKLHPASVSEYDAGNGPVAWLLVIPTTHELMLKFLEKEITENELFDLTPADVEFDALYLCSAIVLEEYRQKGFIKQLALTAIDEIRKEHPLKSLFTWPFTREGDLASEAIARVVSLPLYKR